jgi:hypothetical protein
MTAEGKGRSGTWLHDRYGWHGAVSFSAVRGRRDDIPRGANPPKRARIAASPARPAVARPSRAIAVVPSSLLLQIASEVTSRSLPSA